MHIYVGLQQIEPFDTSKSTTVIQNNPGEKSYFFSSIPPNLRTWKQKAFLSNRNFPEPSIQESLTDFFFRFCILSIDYTVNTRIYIRRLKEK